MGGTSAVPALSFVLNWTLTSSRCRQEHHHHLVDAGPSIHCCYCCSSSSSFSQDTGGLAVSLFVCGRVFRARLSAAVLSCCFPSLSA